MEAWRSCHDMHHVLYAREVCATGATQAVQNLVVHWVVAVRRLCNGADCTADDFICGVWTTTCDIIYICIAGSGYSNSGESKCGVVCKVYKAYRSYVSSVPR